MKVAAIGQATHAKARFALPFVGAAVCLAGCSTMPAVPAAPQDVRIAGSRVFPESITADRQGNLYVGSLHGTVYRALPGAAIAEPWVEANSENGLLSLFGVLADDAGGLLWTCSNPNAFAADSPADAVSSLVAFELDSGAFVASYPFPEGPAACNDIAIAADRTVFVTETAGGRIFLLTPGGIELELFADGEDLVGVDGIAFGADGAMFINNVRANLVQRVDRNPGGDYAGLTTLDLSQPVRGPDGLRPIGGNRFLQAEGSGGRVALITIDGDSATVEPLRSGLESSPGVTHVGRIGYATEGKIGYLVDPQLEGQDPGEFIIRAFPLPEGL